MLSWLFLWPRLFFLCSIARALRASRVIIHGECLNSWSTSITINQSLGTFLTHSLGYQRIRLRADIKLIGVYRFSGSFFYWPTHRFRFTILENGFDWSSNLIDLSSLSLKFFTVDSCDCSNDFALSLSLYFNLMWLLILRPLIVLQTLMMSTEADGSPPTYLDFGTHLVLIFASLSIPFSNSGGLRLESFSNQETLSSTNSCCNQSDKSSISEFDPYKTGKRVTDQYWS